MITLNVMRCSLYKTQPPESNAHSETDATATIHAAKELGTAWSLGLVAIYHLSPWLPQVTILYVV